MTKEELKKEAIQYAVDYPTGYGRGYKHKDLRIAYLAGAEPREKRIAELQDKLKNLASVAEVRLANWQKYEKENTELKKESNNLFLEGAKRVEELEAQIEKMKSQYDYAFNQLCKSREILCSMLSQYRDRKEIDYSTRECGEKLLKEGVYKNDSNGTSQ